MIRTGGILCLFAHPDDEQFGTAAALHSCALRGIPVHVLSATRGDAGEISDSALATRENLAEVREAELRTACAMLGFEEPILLDYRDGFLNLEAPDVLRDVVIGQIRTYKPRVVITFDANGGYGHPDHIAIHHATFAAWPLAGVAEHRPDLGQAHTPDKLYATAFPRSAFALMEQGLRDLGYPGFDLGAVQTIPASEFGTPDEAITTIVNAEPWFDLRYAAMYAHKTQFGENSMFKQFPPELTRQLMQIDAFRRVAPAPGAVLPDEDDVWAGLES